MQQQNRSAVKIGPARLILAAKTGPPANFSPPCENVYSKQFKITRYL